MSADDEHARDSRNPRGLPGEKWSGLNREISAASEDPPRLCSRSQRVLSVLDGQQAS